jgi:type II secretory pathway component PulM
MSGLLQRPAAAFRNLAPRERILVGSVFALLGVAVVWFGIITPMRDAADRVETRVADAERQLEIMGRLQREYAEISGRLEVVEQRIQSGNAGNLRTTLDTLARAVGVPIESMEPQSAPPNDRYRETKLELSLKEVSLPQAVRYLHEIESSNQVLSVKSLRIKNRPDESKLLDITFTVSSFEPI